MGVDLTELALQAKIAIEWGLQGLALVFSGTWSSKSAQITASTLLTPGFVIFKLE